MTASTAQERNPFMLMTHPEVVIAAMEKSERLGRLRRQICRPLDKGAEPLGDAVAARDADAVADAQTDAGAGVPTADTGAPPDAGPAVAVAAVTN